MFHLLLPILPAVAVGYYLLIAIIEVIIGIAIILSIIGIVQTIRYKSAKKKGTAKKRTKVSAIICSILGGIVIVPLIILIVISGSIRASEARKEQAALDALQDKIMLSGRGWTVDGFEYHGRWLVPTKETGGVSRINKETGEVVSTIIDGTFDKKNSRAHYELVKVPSDSGYDVFYVEKEGVFVYEDEEDAIVDYYMDQAKFTRSELRINGELVNKELSEAQCAEFAHIVKKYNDVDVIESYENDEIHNRTKYTAEVGSSDGVFWVTSTVIVADEGVFRVSIWSNDGSFIGWKVSDPVEAELLKSIGK